MVTMMTHSDTDQPTRADLAADLAELRETTVELLDLVRQLVASMESVQETIAEAEQLVEQFRPMAAALSAGGPGALLGALMGRG